MPTADPLSLASGHLTVAARAALDLHRAIGIARAATTDPARRHSLAITLMTNMNTMRQLAAAVDELPEFFRGNLPTSLRLAADQSR